MAEIIRLYQGGSDLSWLKSGLCQDPKTNPTNIDFADPGTKLRAAKAICDTPCPVKTDCLEFALENNVTTGMMGGTFEVERSRLIRQKKKSAKKIN